MGIDDSRRDAWEAMQHANRPQQLLDEPELPLKGGGGGGTFGGMSVSMKDYVDSRDAVVAADMRSEFANLRADIAKLPTTWTLIGTALAIVSILVAVLAFGGARFSGGISLADQRQVQLQRDATQDAATSEINLKLDRILSEVERDRAGGVQAKP